MDSGTSSSHHLREEVHILSASADVRPSIIKTVLNQALHLEFVSSPPSSGDKVPSIISGVDNCASESVDSQHHVLGEGLG